MTRRTCALLGLALLGGVTALAATGVPVGSAADKPSKPSKTAPAPPADRRDQSPTLDPAPTPKSQVVPAGTPPGTVFLHDSVVLARVQDRAIRVGRFVDAYFSSLAQFRPRPDSLGRVEFLTSMVNKEVLALTALAVNRPLGFEERAVMREHTERVLANALYQRAVLDSVVVTDEDVRGLHAEYGREQRYRRIPFDDTGTAAAVRRQILGRTLTWNDAVRRYSKPPATTPDGDMGWVRRSVFVPRTADMVWNLEPGKISEVINDDDGISLLQLVERRKVPAPAFEPMRPMLTSMLRGRQAAVRSVRLQTNVGVRIGMSYDTTNILWAAAKFQGQETVTQEGRDVTLNLGGLGGDLDPGDTSRVLARHRDGRMTLGDFLHEYNHQPPIMRQPVGDFESFKARLDGFVLEPYMADEARSRGLERDSMVVAQVEQKREELLVEHLFRDSVQSRIWIEPAERRRYYDAHVAQYVTYPTARFAAIVRESKAGADSVMARLKAGESAAAILHADSLHGLKSGSIQERRDEGRGGPHHNLLFGELRPGQATVVGPDKEGTWMVLQLLEFDPGRQLPYEQVESYVDESLQNIKSEEMLKALIARHRRRYRIVEHPELVMRIELRDPAGR